MVEYQVGHVLLVEGENSWLGFNDTYDYGTVSGGLTVATTRELAYGSELSSG